MIKIAMERTIYDKPTTTHEWTTDDPKEALDIVATLHNQGRRYTITVDDKRIDLLALSLM